MTNDTKTIDDIEIKQEYYEYPNKARSKAYAVYQGIYNRCYKRDKYTNYHDCYDGATICKEWLENPELFIDWYLENYYPVKDEIMVVDKDLFGNGNISVQGATNDIKKCFRYAEWKSQIFHSIFTYSLVALIDEIRPSVAFLLSSKLIFSQSSR